MKLFSFRMRAISVFTLDTGMSTRRCRDATALRIRVNISAIGSVMLMKSNSSRIRRRGGGGKLTGDGGRGTGDGAVPRSPFSVPCSPRGLSHAGDHPRQRQFAEADAAETKPAEECPPTTAPVAAVVLLHGKFWLALRLLDPGLLRHTLVLAEVCSPSHLRGAGRLSYRRHGTASPAPSTAPARGHRARRSSRR